MKLLNQYRLFPWTVSQPHMNFNHRLSAAQCLCTNNKFMTGKWRVVTVHCIENTVLVQVPIPTVPCFLFHKFSNYMFQHAALVVDNTL